MTKKTDNRSNGGRFEQEFSKILSEHGFWAHVMQQNKAGQPADVIAVKGKYHTLIDCKVISEDPHVFRLARAEENQRLAMNRFLMRGKELCWFAMKMPDGSIWMVGQNKIEYFLNLKRAYMSEEEVHQHGWELGKWLTATDTWAEDT